MFDTLKRYLDEKGSYSRKLDETTNEATEEIEDKHSYHLMDAERVMVSSIFTLRNRIDSDVLAKLAEAGRSRWEMAKIVSSGYAQTNRWQRGRKF